MSISIEMPKLSDTMTEGTLLRWRKKEGEKVEVGDVLADVETDKATMEMEAFDEGVLEKILVSEGQKVPVGSILAQLSSGEGESSSSSAPKGSPSKEESSKQQPAASSQAKSSVPSQQTSPQSSSAKSSNNNSPSSSPATATPSVVPSSLGGKRVKASPLAKKLALSSKKDLSRITGSGPGGRILARDVESAGATGTFSSAVSSSPSGVPLTPPLTNIPHTKIELSGMRRVIAARLLESKTHIPHFYAQVEIDAEPLMRLRKQLNQATDASGASQATAASSPPKITINDFILLATARAAIAHPKVNAAFTESAILQYETVHLAVAVAIEDGLVTPVIRDAQNLSLRQISSAMKDLASRARNKKLKPEEYQGGTITVSSLGTYGIESFCAIINPPQAAILAIGAIMKKPTVNANDQIVIGQKFSLTLSCDHRVIDGAVGAEFLADIRKFIESPESLLLSN